jgi:hypothetical protein
MRLDRDGRTAVETRVSVEGTTRIAAFREAPYLDVRAAGFWSRVLR